MVYQQTQSWLKAGVFEALVHDLRLAAGRKEQPTGTIFDSRTLQSSPESGERVGYNGSQTRFCLAAAPVGSGAQSWLAGAFSTISTRL